MSGQGGAHLGRLVYDGAGMVFVKEGEKMPRSMWLYLVSLRIEKKLKGWRY